MSDSVERLYDGVIAAKHGDPTRSRTARLLRSGRAKMAKKLAEEAVEVVIDAMNGSRDAVIPRYQMMYGFSPVCRTDFSELTMEPLRYHVGSGDSRLRKLILQGDCPRR